MPTKKNNTLQTKKKVLEALEKTLGIVTTACKKVGLTKRWVYFIICELNLNLVFIDDYLTS